MSQNNNEPIYGGVSDWMVQKVINGFMDKYGLTQAHVDKIKSLLDTVSVKDNGSETVITIKVKK